MEELDRLTTRALGACLTSPPSSEEATSLLERGASLLGLASGATPEALGPLRQTIDARLEAEAEAAAAELGTWQSWLERAAALAPGGAALWLGREPDHPLPAGFAWTIAPPDDAGRLPEEHYRLLVLPPGEEPADRRLARWLDAGGVLLTPPDISAEGPVRIIDRSDDPPLVILRRE